MTTGDRPAFQDRRAREVTRLPDRGAVLVRSAGPPRVPADRCVDVRPGPFATFDGERFRTSLTMSVGDRRRRFAMSALPAVEDAVVAALGGEGSSGAGGHEPETAGGEHRAVLRYGDRAACRRTLPDPAAEAIERRLAAAADRASSTLVTWTTGDPLPGDGRRYDVVLDAPTGRQE